MFSSPGYDRFHAFCAQADYNTNDDANSIICQTTTSVIEEEDMELLNPSPSPQAQPYKSKQHDLFNVQTSSEIASQLEVQQKLENRSAQLLSLNQKYGHIPFQRLK